MVQKNSCVSRLIMRSVDYAGVALAQRIFYLLCFEIVVDGKEPTNLIPLRGGLGGQGGLQGRLQESYKLVCAIGMVIL